MRKVCRSALSDIPLTPSSHLIFSMEIRKVTHLLLNIEYIGRHCRLSRKEAFPAMAFETRSVEHVEHVVVSDEERCSP